MIWQSEGLCNEVGPELFYPDEAASADTSMTEAKKVCARCPVRTECLQEALANDEQHGVWGGKTPRERNALKKPKAATAKAPTVGQRERQRLYYQRHRADIVERRRRYRAAS